MKKIILILVLLMMIRVNVSAETYYGNYYIIEGSLDNYNVDEILVEERKIYNTYKEEYKDLGYMFDNENYIKDENDYIEETILVDEYVDGSIQYIELGVLKDKENNFINIGNLPFGKSLCEIEFYYKEELLDITYQTSDILYSSHILDKDKNTCITSISDYGNIKFIFNNNYLLDDVKIVLYNSNGKKISTGFLYSDLDNHNAYRIDINYDKTIITFNSLYEEIQYKFQTNIKKYKYYELVKVPTNNYVENGNNILSDDYKIEYIYYKRDKLIIEDDIIINNVDTDINNFIEYNSGDVITNCNIDYNINGEYICNFKLNDINVDKRVFVDIVKEESTNSNIGDNLYQTNNDIDDNVKDMIDENVEDIITENENDINNSIEYNVNKNEDIINDSVKDNIIDVLKVIEEETKKDIIVENDVIESNSITNKVSKNNTRLLNIVKYIIIWSIISIEVILFIKKKKNKSNVESI